MPRESNLLKNASRLGAICLAEAAPPCNVMKDGWYAPLTQECSKEANYVVFHIVVVNSSVVLMQWLVLHVKIRLY